MKKIQIRTKKQEEVVDITKKVEELVREEGMKEGVVKLFVKHTTAALSVADLDPGTDKDMLEAYRGMLPDLKWRHPHDPKHAPDHILASLIGPSVLVPVVSGRLDLGSWQRVVLFEFNGPRRREIVVDF